MNKMLEKGWVQLSISPHAAPILVGEEKDGSMRMCVDYKALNKQTIRNNYPLPRIDDTLDQLTGAMVFSCLDVAPAYHQVRLPEADVPKTAFKTPSGLFEYRVLPFGLTNAPAFQALMNHVLGPLLGRTACLIYLNDILVYSKDIQEHAQHLEQLN